MIELYKWFDEFELKRRRWSFTFVLYPETEIYNTDLILETVKELEWKGEIKEYAYILHDKDNVKPHYHLAIKYKGQRVLKSVLDMLHLQLYNPNEQTPLVSDWKALLHYLLHDTKDTADKHQYNEDEVISNIPDVINGLRDKPEKIDVFLEIVDYIQNAEAHYLQYLDVINYCKQRPAIYMQVLMARNYNYAITTILKERNMI